MKKNKFVPVILTGKISAYDQPEAVGLRPFEQEQQQALSGIVTLPAEGTGDLAVEAVADVTPLRTTAAVVAVEAMRVVPAPVTVGIKLPPVATINRKVLVNSNQDELATTAAAVDAVAGTTLIGTLTFDGGEKNNAPMTNAVADGVGKSTELNALLATTKPSFSLQSILQKLEDLARDEVVSLVAFFDQGANGGRGTLKVYQVDTDAHADSAWAATNTGGSELAVFYVNTTPASTADKQAGE